MTQENKFLLSLIGSVISGESDYPELDFEPDWVKLYELSKKHSIANIIGYGITGGKYNVPADIKEKFSKKIFQSVAVSENQMSEFTSIFKAFEENNIDYMPLKGLEIKNLYASSDMRNMSDGDVLIKTEQYEKIDEIMKKLGYVFELESNHEYVYRKPPFVNVELHKLLIPSYNEDLYAYYGDGWKLAENNDSTRYKLNTEDNFIYIFTHFAKHYRDGGAGIKYISDIWLYLKKNAVDMSYVMTEFEKLGLREFAENIFKLAKVWFENEQSDELTDDMTEYILNSGQYGNIQNAAIANELRENQNTEADDLKKNKLVRMLFPSRFHMKENYAVLKKYPFLLPFVWGYRIIKNVVLFKNSAKIYNQKKEYLADEKLSSFDKHMKSVGLDIYNGRKK